MIDLKREKEKFKLQESILKWFELKGLHEDVKHIISETDKNPTITMQPATKDDFKRIIEAIKTDLLPFYKTKSGTVGFKPVLPVEVAPEGENITRAKGFYKIDTKTDKYNSENLFRVVCYVRRTRETYFTLWIDINYKFMDEKFYFTETIKDTYETDTARQYNRRHADIMTQRRVFKGLERVNFWGGCVTHFAINEEQKQKLNKILGVEE